MITESQKWFKDNVQFVMIDPFGIEDFIQLKDEPESMLSLEDIYINFKARLEDEKNRDRLEKKAQFESDYLGVYNGY
jgi:hypothetical protein